MADGHPHLRLPALAVGIDGLSGETAPVPDTDVDPSGVDRTRGRVCCMHVLHMPAEPPDSLMYFVQIH